MPDAAAVGLGGGKGENALPDGTAKAAEREARRLTEPHDDRTRRLLLGIEHDGRRAERTRIESEATPLRLRETFPAVPTDAWDAVVLQDLQGQDYETRLVWHTDEGLAVQPFCRHEDLEGLGTETMPPPGESPFVRGNAEKLTLELFCDSTNKGMGIGAQSVTKETDKYYQLVKLIPALHAPPVVTFIWNDQFPGNELGKAWGGSQRRTSFTGVAESVRSRFTVEGLRGLSGCPNR